jgi:hypothetical protein
VEPLVLAHRENPTPSDVRLVPVASDAEPTDASVFIERPGANMDRWPGQIAIGTAFVLFIA